MSQPAPAHLAAGLRQVFAFRGPPPGARGLPFKEWLHLSTRGDGIDLLVNLSRSDDARPAASPGASRGQLMVIARSEDGWSGDTTSLPGASVCASVGGLSAPGFDARLVDGALSLRAELPRRGIRIALTLRPACLPFGAHNLRFGQGACNWAAMPRLIASGEVQIGDRRHVVDGALAYLDHNWGAFLWGGDFAWEWAYLHPDDPAIPWSMILIRMLDRARSRVLRRSAVLWRGAMPWRSFDAGEVAFSLEGARGAGPSFCVPRAARALSPGHAQDVPRAVQVQLNGEDAALQVDFAARDRCRVLLPSERDPLGVSIINEVFGPAAVRGRVGGEEVCFDGRAVFEFVRS